MPELPEVETVRATLEKMLEHPMIESVDIYWDKIIAYPEVDVFKEKIKGERIQDYKRIGKYLIFELDHYYLISHLRMEGKYYVEDILSPYDQKHTHVVFMLDSKKELRYHDTRKFGRMHLYEKGKPLLEYDAFKNLGYDVFDEHVTTEWLYEKWHKKKLPLKQMLLDQSYMAGVGNIYADEICFACGFHPLTLTSRLRKKDIELIIYHTRRILSGAIKAGGTTIRSYTSSLGVDGRFQLQLKVHGKGGQMCPICGEQLKKIKVNTRGTTYCQNCQKRR